jgi:hypothetical protein
VYANLPAVSVDGRFHATLACSLAEASAAIRLPLSQASIDGGHCLAESLQSQALASTSEAIYVTKLHFQQ